MRAHDSPQVMPAGLRWGLGLVVCLSLAGLLWRATARTIALAQGAVAAPSATASSATLAALDLPTTASARPSSTPLAPTAAASPVASATASDAPTPTGTAGLAPTEVVTSSVDCAQYSQTSPDLLTLVSKDLALPRDYRPADLAIVPLTQKNQAFQPIPLRRPVHQALLDMLDAMNQAGLSIWVMSGYRSYSDQQLAFDKWLKLYPDRVVDISAVPGHSEHQLGTAIDFSTPYMANLYGDFFNVRFSQTPEGQWLGRQAAYYGFTLSYPAGATPITGYAWEPWHYRYVGALAQDLLSRNLTLTQYVQECAPH